MIIVVNPILSGRVTCDTVRHGSYRLPREGICWNIIILMLVPDVRNIRNPHRSLSPQTSHDLYRLLRSGILGTVRFKILGNDLFGLLIRVDLLAKMVIESSQDFSPRT